MAYPLQHEFFALRRYCARHYYSDIERVDPEWYDDEISSIYRLLEHDDIPPEVEIQEIKSKYLACHQCFPFLVEEKYELEGGQK